VSSGDPLALTSRFREAVASGDPDLPLYSVDSLAGGIEAGQWFYRVFGSLFMIFGFVALLLAGVGLYGVMSFSVGQRTREVGVRMALGAHRGDILSLIMRQGMLQLAIGLALGLTLALGVSRLLTVLLFDVSPRDPFIFTTIVIVLTATVSLACFIPARRATRVAPLEALRFD
jgi:ABC-type antimicrobial peptide transport system permease subunit